MIPDAKKKDLEKQGYRIVGSHSAIKVCLWTKKCLRDEDVCYKNTFYGINTHRCVQMTPALQFCNHRCAHCWRDTDFTQKEWSGEIDSPKSIVDSCIREHVEYLEGFKGNPKCNLDKFEEAKHPLHFAISLSGEPTLYPKLPELVDEIKSRGMTSFLVTNGTNPDMLEKLKGHEPTQLYITLPAPDEETYIKACAPLIKGSWQRILKSVKVLGTLNTRRTIRLTLVKNLNMIKPEKWAELFRAIEADFFELKAYVWVGFSRERLNIENMPRHEDIINFAKQIISHCPGLKIIDEKPQSRVVLLMKQDKKSRVMKF